MADRYFDWDRGSDSNDGLTPSTPKKTYSLTGTANGDDFYFRRGTTQIVTTQYMGVRSGTSAGNRTVYDVYGEGQVDWAGFRAGHAFGDMILNCSIGNYRDFRNLRFDATGCTHSLYCAAQSSTPTTDTLFSNCHFYNSNSSGLSIQQESSATAQPANYRIDNCEFYNNKAHGVSIVGARGVAVNNSVFRNNAFSSSFGGHGLTARTQRTEPSGGWSSMGGGVYRRALGAAETTVYYVRNAVGSDSRMTKNTATPTTPASGEFGQSGGFLYVNVGGSDPGANVSYAWGICDRVIVTACVAYGNVWDRNYLFHEGHGFAFDDWTQDSAFIGCLSYDNQGLGFSINRGDRNLIMGCVAYDNWRGGVAINGSARSNRLYTSTFVDNAQGDDPLNSEISIAGLSATNTLVRNCAIQGSVLYGVNFDGNASGCEATYNAIRGYSDAVRNGTESNTVTDDPLLDSSYRPTALSPCRGAGIYLPEARHMGGKRMSVVFPDIGAYRYFAVRDVVTDRNVRLVGA